MTVDEQALARAREFVADALSCPVAEISVEDHFGSTPHWDSLAHVVLLTHIESQFGIETKPWTIEHFSSVRAIAELFTECAGESHWPVPAES